MIPETKIFQSSYGVKIAWESYGDPQGTPLLFLHGMMGRKEDWREFTQYLQKQKKASYFFLAVDLPGHGQSSLCPTTDIFLQSWEEFLRLFPFHSHPHLIGYSMGGRWALTLAVKYPQLFSSVILESSSPGIKDQEERRLRLAADQKLFQDTHLQQQSSWRDFLIKWYQQDLFGSLNKDPRFAHFLQARETQNDPQVLQKALDILSVGRQESLWESLPHFPLPFLFISGDEDKRYTHMGKEICTYVSQAEHAIFPHCGHTVHWQNPQKMAEVVHIFLQKLLSLSVGHG